MSRPYEPLLEYHVDVLAPPERVWALVSDVRRMPEWSPQVTSVRLRASFERVELGTQFTNRNRHGDLEWTTRGEIVRFTQDHEVAFRIEENRVVWSFTLQETTQGHTRLTQRRETPEGISDVSLDLTDSHLGGQETFTAVLREGMRQTLERVKAAVEGEAARS